MHINPSIRCLTHARFDSLLRIVDRLANCIFMAEGDFLIDSDGNFLTDADGNWVVFNSSNECPECCEPSCDDAACTWCNDNGGMSPDQYLVTYSGYTVCTTCLTEDTSPSQQVSLDVDEFVIESGSGGIQSPDYGDCVWGDDNVPNMATIRGYPMANCGGTPVTHNVEGQVGVGFDTDPLVEEVCVNIQQSGSPGTGTDVNSRWHFIGSAALPSDCKTTITGIANNIVAADCASTRQSIDRCDGVAFPLSRIATYGGTVSLEPCGTLSP